MLSLNDQLAALAIDIRPQLAEVAIIDLNGRLLSSNTLPIGNSPERAVQAIVNCMKRIRDEHPDSVVEGVGVSVPGRVSLGTQRLVFAPNLPWTTYDLKQAIEQQMGLPAEIENAATASLMSALWFGLMKKTRDAVLVTLFDGIGTGIMAEGKLIRGNFGTAGEFAHIQIDPAGPRCVCGQVGCWETLASPAAALRDYRQFRAGAGPTAYAELLELADQGDPCAVQTLARQARYLGRGMRMVALALSPECILVAGELAAAWERFQPAVEQELRHPPLPGGTPGVCPMYESDMARIRGAAAVLLERRTQSPRARNIFSGAVGDAANDLGRRPDINM